MDSKLFRCLSLWTLRIFQLYYYLKGLQAMDSKPFKPWTLRIFSLYNYLKGFQVMDFKSFKPWTLTFHVLFLQNRHGL